MNLLLYGSLAILLLTHNGKTKFLGRFKEIENELSTVLNFCDTKYKQIHFDGLLGISLTHTFLAKALSIPSSRSTKLEILALTNKCKAIRTKIYPLLPNEPKYMINFRNKLLNIERWMDIVPNKFFFGKIEHMGTYKNWTSDIITKNKVASYKGIKSDVCMREILEISQWNEQCYVSDICQEMMLKNRVDYGYLLTHRLLYLHAVKLQNCKLPDFLPTKDEYSSWYCSYIYKEAKTSEMLRFPYHDIFLEQVVLCGMEGYAEFLNEKWINEIISWKNPHGCYESMRRNITKRTSFTIDFGCSDHTTGLAAAALALHMNYMLYLQEIV